MKNPNENIHHSLLNENNRYFLKEDEFQRMTLLTQGYTVTYVADVLGLTTDAIYGTIKILKLRFNVDSRDSVYFIIGAKKLIPIEVIMENMQKPDKNS